MNKPYLSKSQYLKGTQCPKLLWLSINESDTAGPFDQVSEWRLIMAGHLRQLAQGLFPGCKSIPQEYGHHEEGLEFTARCVKDNAPAIFKPAASGGHIFSHADILRRVPGRRKIWDLYEIKMSTGVKEPHITSAALQRFCFEEAGYNLRHSFLMHVNTHYVHMGNIKTDQLLLPQNITDRVMADMKGIKGRISNFIKILARNICPEVEAGIQCKSPYLCPYFDKCNIAPRPYTIYDLKGKGRNIKRLEEAGIEYLKDIPQNFSLSDKNTQQIKSFKSKKPAIDKGAIQVFLGELRYPLYFLDFETVSNAIPLFIKSRPYQNVPFQYSLHIRRTKRAKLEHRECLSESPGDPREHLIESMLEHLGGKGTILAWNMTFERSCISYLADVFPKYQKSLMALLPRINDLIIPFKSGAYSHYLFHGKSSLKNVLPVLVPRLSYGTLNIRDGMTASIMAAQWYYGAMPPEQWSKVRKDLLKYCRLDTLAMVEILKVLEKVSV